MAMSKNVDLPPEDVLEGSEDVVEGLEALAGKCRYERKCDALC